MFRAKVSICNLSRKEPCNLTSVSFHNWITAGVIKIIPTPTANIHDLIAINSLHFGLFPCFLPLGASSPGFRYFFFQIFREICAMSLRHPTFITQCPLEKLPSLMRLLPLHSASVVTGDATIHDSP